MSQQRFSNRTLVGNWFEQRFNPAYTAVQSPELKEMRDKNDSITWLGASGLPKPLNAINRFKKWSTQGVIPNDGRFRESTTFKETMLSPQKLQNKPLGIMNSNGKTHSLISQRNAMSLKESHKTGNWLGYNFIDSSVPKEEEKRYFETSYSSTMNSPDFVLRRKDNTQFDYSLTTSQQFYKVPERAQSEIKSPSKKQKPNKRNILAAEILRTSFDPQHDTRMQKLWVSGGDPGLEAKLKFGDTLRQESDSFTGFGNRLASNKDHNRRIRTEITNVPVFHHALNLR